MNSQALHGSQISDMHCAMHSVKKAQITAKCYASPTRRFSILGSRLSDVLYFV